MARLSEAQKMGRELVERLDGGGWEIKVFDGALNSEAWWYKVELGGLTVYACKGWPGGYGAKLDDFPDDRDWAPDPNEAVRQCLAAARAHIAELQAAITSATGEEPRLFTAGEMRDAHLEAIMGYGNHEDQVALARFHSAEKLWLASDAAVLVSKRKGE